jgi:tetratricopeptide (TPR) repeat protein
MIKSSFFFLTLFLFGCVDKTTPSREADKPTIWLGYPTPNYDKIRSYANKIEAFWINPKDLMTFHATISAGEQLLNDPSIQSQPRDLAAIYVMLHMTCRRNEDYADALKYSNRLIEYLDSTSVIPNRLTRLGQAHLDKASDLMELRDFDKAKEEIRYIIQNFNCDVLLVDPSMGKKEGVSFETATHSNQWNMAESAVDLLGIVYSKELINQSTQKMKDKTNEAVNELHEIYNKHRGSKIGVAALMNEFRLQITRGDKASLKDLRRRLQKESSAAGTYQQQVVSALKAVDSQLNKR